MHWSLETKRHQSIGGLQPYTLSSVKSSGLFLRLRASYRLRKSQAFSILKKMGASTWTSKTKVPKKVWKTSITKLNKFLIAKNSDLHTLSRNLKSKMSRLELSCWPYSHFIQRRRSRVIKTYKLDLIKEQLVCSLIMSPSRSVNVSSGFNKNSHLPRKDMWKLFVNRLKSSKSLG